ncbi:MAG: lactate racemase domain-containing protein [bacterium]
MYEVTLENNLQKVVLPQYFWYDRQPLPLVFPHNWDIKICGMEGDYLPILGQEEIKRKISNPIGTFPLEELAKGKKEVAIVVDDITRPTEASLLLPYILEALSKAGMRDDCIRFLISLGSHGAHTAEDFRKKIGNEIVERFGVYNHNCYENCVEVGKTKSGMVVKINAELMQCDFKIGIGAILPHLYVGYSGGGKLFLPGMAHIDTIDAFHSFLTPGEKGRINFENPMMREIEDALALIGVDFKIDVLVNTKGQIIDLFAGETMAEYSEGVKVADKIYVTKTYDDLDVVISNAHLKVNEGDIALLAGLETVKEDGTCVLIMNSPSGQMTHYLMRWFGKFIGGKQAVTRVQLPEDKKVIVYSQYKDTITFDPFENQEIITWEKDWVEIIQQLQARHGSEELRVGIIPDGTIQYIKR